MCASLDQYLQNSRKIESSQSFFSIIVNKTGLGLGGLSLALLGVLSWLDFLGFLFSGGGSRGLLLFTLLLWRLWLSCDLSLLRRLLLGRFLFRRFLLCRFLLNSRCCLLRRFLGLNSRFLGFRLLNGGGGLF